MKTIAALFLAGLLAIMAYGVFWLVCLTYSTGQMKDAVRDALQAEMTYGTPQWVPDPAHVTMDLPNVKLVMAQGPVRELRGNSLRLVSDFLIRDRWTMQLPARVDVVLANGATLTLATEGGEVAWKKADNTLSFRADKVALVDRSGVVVAEVGDAVLERRAFDADVKINLASRPKLAGGEAVISGQMSLPADAFARVVDLYGRGDLPGLGTLFGVITQSLQQKGGVLKLDNVSFKNVQTGVSGAVFGDIKVLGDGRMTGTMALSADTMARVAGWIERANILAPRTSLEQGGVARYRAVAAGQGKGVVRLENMQSTLMLNGFPVGPLPVASEVVRNLW